VRSGPSVPRSERPPNEQLRSWTMSIDPAFREADRNICHSSRLIDGMDLLHYWNAASPEAFPLAVLVQQCSA
jgi:hypothetical protein